jgi:adenosyl cobinamide kinase/adenosyl cobinamide phosphate guanylyltransferase
VLILILGGARSGKSAVAEQLAAGLPQPVTYLATLATDVADPDPDGRIAAHRARRPEPWSTIEATSDLAAQLGSLTGTLLLDSLGPWVACHQSDGDSADALAAALVARAGDTVVVSDEVGLSVHPTTTAGIVFRDMLGRVNHAVAGVADRTLLVVAGRVVPTAPLDVDAFFHGGG